MKKCLAFALIVMIAINGILAAPRPDDTQSLKATCSPWLGYCQLTEQCCRDLECLGYLAKCVRMQGIRPPGEDNRPIGDGPFPPTRAPFDSNDFDDNALELEDGIE